MPRSMSDINKDIVAQGKIIQDKNSSNDEKKVASQKLLKLNREAVAWFKNN